MEDEKWDKEQEKLASLVIIPTSGGYAPSKGNVILALDIQYNGGWAHVAGDLHYWDGDHIGTYAGVIFIDIKYVPGYFCFREGPPLLALVERLGKESLPKPDLIIVDGHGIAHPRRFGVACWMGIATGKPTIGCAKEPLLKYEGEPGKERGSSLKVINNGEHLGHILRTQDGVRSIFVSPGHLVSLETSRSTVLQLSSDFRIPDPIRRADHAARAHCKGMVEQIWKDLGTLDRVVPFFEDKDREDH